MANIIDNSKKLTQLSAIIATIFAEGVKDNPSFAITGYDITGVITNMRMNFSHQQIYRELKCLSFLKCMEVPQEGKPNKKMYSINIDVDAYINNVHNSIDFDPRKTHTKNMYAFSHLPILVCAFNAHMEHCESKETEHQKLTKKSQQDGNVEFALSDLHELNCEFEKLMTDRLLHKISKIYKTTEASSLPKDVSYAIEILEEKYPTFFSG